MSFLGILFVQHVYNISLNGCADHSRNHVEEWLKTDVIRKNKNKAKKEINILKKHHKYQKTIWKKNRLWVS